MSVGNFEHLLNLHRAGERECQKVDKDAWVVYSNSKSRFELHPRTRCCCIRMAEPSEEDNYKTWSVFAGTLQTTYGIDPKKSALASWIGDPGSRVLTHSEFEELIQWAERKQEQNEMSETLRLSSPSSFFAARPKMYLLCENGVRQELGLEQVVAKIGRILPGTELEKIQVIAEVIHRRIREIFYKEVPLYITEKRLDTIILSRLDHEYRRVNNVNSSP